MEPAPEALPDDIAALHALIVSERVERLRADAEAARLQTEAARLQHEVARLTALTERLDHIIAQLRRLQFGKRSEALDPSPARAIHHRRCAGENAGAGEAEARPRGSGERCSRGRCRGGEGRPGPEGRADPAAARRPSVAARSPASGGEGDRADEHDLPLLCRPAAPDRRGRLAPARRGAGPVPDPSAVS